MKLGPVTKIKKKTKQTTFKKFDNDVMSANIFNTALTLLLLVKVLSWPKNPDFFGKES